MATEYGFVYFLGNDSMPGIFKIGFTMGHPKSRMAQLSGSTACPTPFDLIATFGIENPRQAEQEIHARLRHFRVNESREFFAVSPLVLQQIAREYGDSYEDLFLTAGLDALCYIQEEDDELKWKRDHFFEQSADPVHWPRQIEGFD